MDNERRIVLFSEGRMSGFLPDDFGECVCKQVCALEELEQSLHTECEILLLAAEGLQFCKTVFELFSDVFAEKKISVILLVEASAELDFIDACLQLGAADVLRTPWDSSDNVFRINLHLRFLKKYHTIEFQRVKPDTETLFDRLQESEIRYQRIFTNAPVPMLIHADGKLININKAGIDFVRADSASQLIGKSVLSFIPKQIDREIVAKRVSLLQQEIPLDTAEIEILTLDGQKKTVEINGNLLDSTNNTMLTTLIDITQVVEYESKMIDLLEETLHTKKMLYHIIDAVPGCIFAKDSEGKYLFGNHAYSRYLGISLRELKGKTDAELREKNKNESNNNVQILELQRHTDTLLTSTCEFFDAQIPITDCNGNLHYFDTYVSCLTSGETNDEIFGRLFYAHDVTHEVETQNKLELRNENLEQQVLDKAKQLEHSRTNFKQLFERTHDSIVITDSLGNVVEANRKFRSMLGYENEELVGMNIDKFMSDKYPIDRKKLISDIYRNGYSIFESENVTKTGERIPVEINSTLLNRFGQVMILSVGRDIRERKETQKRILKAILNTEEAERNRVAKEVHDGLGALLSSAKMYIDVILSSEMPPEDYPPILEKAKAVLDETALCTREIANNILPHALSNLGLAVAVQSLCERLNETGKINLLFNFKNYIIQANRDLELNLYRIISELLNNTIKHAQAKNVDIELLSDGNSLVLNYSDDGKGFNLQEKLSHDNKGNGIRNIINRTESIFGTYTFHSEPGKGMSVKLIVDSIDLG